MDLSLFIESQVKEGLGIAYSPIKKTKILKSGNAMSFAQERLWFLNDIIYFPNLTYTPPSAVVDPA